MDSQKENLQLTTYLQLNKYYKNIMNLENKRTYVLLTLAKRMIVLTDTIYGEFLEEFEVPT